KPSISKPQLSKPSLSKPLLSKPPLSKPPLSKPLPIKPPLSKPLLSKLPPMKPPPIKLLTEVLEHTGKVAYRLALPEARRPTRQVLVQWTGSSPEEATWEYLSEIQEAYPSYHLEDMVFSEREKNVMPRRSKRVRKGADNLKRMGQDIVQDSIYEQDFDLEEDQEEDGDDGDIFNMWDITVKDVKRIRQFLTPNVPDVMDDIIQPLIPKTIHTTPPDEDYVAPTTKSILDDLLEEFGDEILNVAMVNEGAECSPTKDLEELKRLLTKDSQSHYTEIQVHLVIINLGPFIHTQLMSPLYGVFKTSKPCKVDRDIISHGRLKKDQEKDKIRTKRDKNGKRGEAGKCQKQLQ
nr:hypothetical protein [Tanacetum cinerariifolium]